MKYGIVAAIAAAGVIGGCQATQATRPAAVHDTGTAQAPATAPAADAPRAAGGTTIVLPAIDPHAGAVPPEMLEALRQMASDDFSTRENAVKQLEAAMTRQFQQMVQVQDLLLHVQDGLASQLAQLTQTPDDAGKNRVAGLMEFNSAVSRWAVDVMAMAEPQREAFLQWGIQEENLPLVARAYNRSGEVRAKAARELAKKSGAEVDWLLVQMLNDTDREVSLTAIDAVADRPPTPPIVDTLWDHAVSPAMSQFRQRAQRQRTVTIRGRTIVIYDQDPNTNGTRQQDADIVADILIGYKSEEITSRLNAMFKEMSAGMTNGNDYRWRVISPNYGDAGKAIGRLLDAYKPREAVPFLMKVLAMEINDGGDSTINNNEKVRYSSSIDAAAMLIKAIGQDPDDYGVKKYANFGDRWVIKGGLPEEAALKKKLQTWWKDHQKDYAGGGAAATIPATTGPATGAAAGVAATQGGTPALVIPGARAVPNPVHPQQPAIRWTDVVVPE